MSKIAKYPVSIPGGVDVNIAGRLITIKSNKGELSHDIHPLVKVLQEDNKLKVTVTNNSKLAKALSGTTRALMQNMVTGVTEGFERKLNIVGVGYRAAVSGKVLNLSLGFSHPVAFAIPAGITIETPSQTEIIVKGIDKQKVGQIAANIRRYRQPEPYKGKGVRYADERIIRKETKKS